MTPGPPGSSTEREAYLLEKNSANIRAQQTDSAGVSETKQSSAYHRCKTSGGRGGDGKEVQEEEAVNAEGADAVTAMLSSFDDSDEDG